MPTTHVGPESQDNLQGIAKLLLKARKVVVVTGAGISTNSGIPDFRSENGLYSLIQTQFDAAARQARQAEEQSSSFQDAGEYGDERPRKRPRISRETSSGPSDASEEIKDVIQVVEPGTIYVKRIEPGAPTVATVQDQEESESVGSDAVDTLPVFTPRRTRRSVIAAQAMTSPLSSPPPEDLIIPPSAFRKHTQSRVTDGTITPSSSPLSSPPPVLFDPFSMSSPSDGDPSLPSSTVPSEAGDSPTPTNLFSSSQASSTGRSALPNMKGKDLFDASIWSDPLRTSVFYTFATSLRQKIKDVEPTSSHRFISHLRDRGKLVRCYTQNIDQIEEKVGLSTTLQDGPGSRGRFSRKSTANINQLSKMVEEAANLGNDSNSLDKSQQSSQGSSPPSLTASTDGTETRAVAELPTSQSGTSKGSSKPAQREIPRSGVECVFLHGSLEQLRCFLCGGVCSWDDDDRESETMSGQQPECPHCVGATTAREEKGKRALGVGKLRPDIVLYGEEHPNAHLISPIVTHDLNLSPDMLLILGTSLRVHGLKVMVREFAKAVHTKGGKVVFVNFTKPPESSWGDVIDYWIELDCDAWVSDLQDKIPTLWQVPEPAKPRRRREQPAAIGDNESPEVKKPPPANPVALRDTRAVAAYHVTNILKNLRTLTGREPLETKPQHRRASVSTMNLVTKSDDSLSSSDSPRKTRSRRSRKSAPGALEGPSKKPSSTLNPNHGRSRRNASPAEQPITPEDMAKHKRELEPFEVNDFIETVRSNTSILDSVKSNPRIRKRKKIDGEEVKLPSVGTRPILHPMAKTGYRPTEEELTLPSLRPQDKKPTPSAGFTLIGHERAETLEKPAWAMPQWVAPLTPLVPRSSALSPISANRQSSPFINRSDAFSFNDPLCWWQFRPSVPPSHQLDRQPPPWNPWSPSGGHQQAFKMQSQFGPMPKAALLPGPQQVAHQGPQQTHQSIWQPQAKHQAVHQGGLLARVPAARNHFERFVMEDPRQAQQQAQQQARQKAQQQAQQSVTPSKMQTTPKQSPQKPTRRTSQRARKITEKAAQSAPRKALPQGPRPAATRPATQQTPRRPLPRGPRRPPQQDTPQPLAQETTQVPLQSPHQSPLQILGQVAGQTPPHKLIRQSTVQQIPRQIPAHHIPLQIPTLTPPQDSRFGNGLEIDSCITVSRQCRPEEAEAAMGLTSLRDSLGPFSPVLNNDLGANRAAMEDITHWGKKWAVQGA
ncbi:hypothetical protein G7046_g5805 [Stylonectria norvegica]|nr:hypothetical protein G7046_g5805 [Stylonectria norvegica]